MLTPQCERTCGRPASQFKKTKTTDLPTKAAAISWIDYSLATYKIRLFCFLKFLIATKKRVLIITVKTPCTTIVNDK